MGGDEGYWQDIEMETNLAYCSKCKVHGHELANCRKVISHPAPKHITTAAVSDYGLDNLYTATIAQGRKNDKMENAKQQWIQVRKK